MYVNYTSTYKHLLGLCGGDDMGISLGSMKDKEEEEQVLFPDGLLTAWSEQQHIHIVNLLNCLVALTEG